MPASTPTLSAFSWSTVPTSYPPAVTPEPRTELPLDRGVLTHAFASAGAAVRTALKKAF